MVPGFNFGGQSSKKKVNNKLEGIMMVANVNAGTVPDMKAGHYSSPLSAIALAAGRLFRPSNKEIQAIDDQLNSIIDQSEGILKEKAKPAETPVDRTPIVLEPVKVEKVQNYKDALPLVVETGPEMKEMIEDVKEFATKYKGTINFTSDVKPAMPEPVDDRKASMDMLVEMKSRSGRLMEGKPIVKPEIKDPLALDGDMLAKLKQSEAIEARPALDDPLALDGDMLAKLRQSASMEVKVPPPEAKPEKKGALDLDGDFMAKLQQVAKVEVAASSAKDIRRGMANCHVTCDDLESDLAEISLKFKTAARRSARRR